MSMRVLVIAHNHPDFHPGGTEIFAHDLFKEMRSRRNVEALFLAATNRIYREPRPGTAFQSVGDAPDEVIMWSGNFDRFYLSQTDTYGTVPHLVNLLEDFRPDVVHIHHLLLIGVETIALIRRIVPQARIVMTLHDYYGICHHDGLMMRTKGRERCNKASPSRCSTCFPDIAADRFLLREQFIKTLFSQIDLFIAPSHFIKDRYVAWGLDADSIVVVANGRPAVQPAPHRETSDGRRAVFGYFGNINPWKGVPTLLKAAQQVASAGLDGFELRLHGSALFQTDQFIADLQEMAKGIEPSVISLGSYKRDEIPQLMAAVDWVVMPSIWWENAPLVIQEAFLHRRPVIASNIGGMAEAVRDGVNGLHVRADDPSALASAIRRAASTPGLWETLVSGIDTPPHIGDVADRHLGLYRTLSGKAEVISFKASAA